MDNQVKSSHDFSTTFRSHPHLAQPSRLSSGLDRWLDRNPHPWGDIIASHWPLTVALFPEI